MEGESKGLFYRLGRATALAAKAMQKTPPGAVLAPETLEHHGTVTLLVHERPDGERVVLLKAKGAYGTVFAAFDRARWEAFKAEVAAIRL